MDMNSLIHHRGAGAGAAPAMDSFRAPATGMSPFQNPGLPGLRPHLPSLPIRLAALHPQPTDPKRAPQSAPAAASAPASSGAPSPGTVSSSTSSSSVSSSSSSSVSMSSSQQATALAPLRFIIPSSHCPPAYTVSSENTNVAIRPANIAMKHDPSLGVSRSFSDPSVLVHDPSRLLHHQLNRPPAINITLSHPTGGDMDSTTSTDGSASDGRNKKSPGKRNRAVKNPNRSTKSKARPGLRKGKWTEEEERYATQLTNYFKEGLLPIERGTMLRLYLSQKLNCEPMRITKKFTGGECIGKQVFRPCSPTPESRVRLMQAQLELVALEAAFIKKLKENKEEVPGLTDDVDTSLAPGAIAVSARPKKRRPFQRDLKMGEFIEDNREEGFTSDSSTASDATASAKGKKKGENVDDASAVGLLLDFFYKASKNENDSSDSSTAKLTAFPKREVSTATSAASSEPEPEVDDEPAYKAANEELANSPTKRMRTLSISQCHTDVTSPKRSRVGSFTAVTSTS